MIILNELLSYPKIKIYQDPEMFHFSLDSMLLAHFASVTPKMKNIIDLCSGNGPIPLYLTLRSKAKILGIEIQKEAYELAEKSVKINGMETQIHMINEDLKTISNKIGQGVCDLVTCNPPFFKYNETSRINKNDFLTIARHEVKVTLEDIVKEASILLKNGGLFAMVHRCDRLIEIFDVLRKYHIEPKRLQFVYPRIHLPVNHILIEGKKNGASGGLNVLEPLIVYEGENWSKQINKIYNYGMEE